MYIEYFSVSFRLRETDFEHPIVFPLKFLQIEFWNTLLDLYEKVQERARRNSAESSFWNVYFPMEAKNRVALLERDKLGLNRREHRLPHVTKRKWSFFLLWVSYRNVRRFFPSPFAAGAAPCGEKQAETCCWQGENAEFRGAFARSICLPFTPSLLYTAIAPLTSVGAFRRFPLRFHDRDWIRKWEWDLG